LKCFWCSGDVAEAATKIFDALRWAENIPHATVSSLFYFI